MSENRQQTDLAVDVVALWLEKRGFSEAATHLLQASEELSMEIDTVKYVAWLDYRHDLKKAYQSSGGEDDLPW